MPRSPAAGTPPQLSRPSGYLPSLDGWRALAILAVIMVHDTPWTFHSWSNAAWKPFTGDGVFLFFSISGLLICWRILEEERLVGSFHLRRFYIRRLFRIQPAALVYLAVILLLQLTGAIHQLWRFWFGALALVQNFLFHNNDPQLILLGIFTGHFWTLAVEEHFYILLSLLLFFVRRHRIPVFLAALVLLNLGQKLAFSHGLFSADVSPRRTPWLLQWLLWPATLALLLQLPRLRAAAQRFLHPWVAFTATAVLVEFHALAHAHTPSFVYLRERSTLLLLAPVCLVSTMLHGRSWSTRLLELPPLRWLGRLSYSLYLWHVFFFHVAIFQISEPWIRPVGLRPWRYLASFLAAILSYYLVEKPCIRLGHRLAPPATPGHRDLGDRPLEPHDPVPPSHTAPPTPPAASEQVKSALALQRRKG